MTGEPEGPTTREERAMWRTEPHIFNLVWEKRALRMMDQLDALADMRSIVADWLYEQRGLAVERGDDEATAVFYRAESVIERLPPAHKLADAMMEEERKT